WLARVRRAGGDQRFAPGGPDDLDVSKGVELLQTETARVRSERGVHVHGFGNPHYWLDPANARPITRAILEALARLAPADRDAFAANRTRFLARLDDALARWTEALAPYRGTRAVVVHDSWPYFAQRFGLVVVAAIEPAPGVPPSASSLAALTQKMRETGVRLLIAEPSSNAALVSQVAARSGARAVVLVPSVGAAAAGGDHRDRLRGLRGGGRARRGPGTPGERAHQAAPGREHPDGDACRGRDARAAIRADRRASLARPPPAARHLVRPRRRRRAPGRALVGLRL